MLPTELRYSRLPCSVFPLFLAFFLSLFFSSEAQHVTTQHNDLKRTGWNAGETQLTQANVSGGSFGKLFIRAVDEQIYCQPLIVNHVNISGGSRNIVVVATVNNTVYAFDADDSAASAPYWQNNLTYNPGNTHSYRAIQNSDMTGACGGNYKDFSGKMGIVGTPVIDTGTNTPLCCFQERNAECTSCFCTIPARAGPADGCRQNAPSIYHSHLSRNRRCQCWRRHNIRSATPQPAPGFTALSGNRIYFLGLSLRLGTLSWMDHRLRCHYTYTEICL